MDLEANAFPAVNMDSVRAAAQPQATFLYGKGIPFVIEAATGKTLSAYMSEKLWQPMGVKTEIAYQWFILYKGDFTMSGLEKSQYGYVYHPAERDDRGGF